VVFNLNERTKDFLASRPPPLSLLTIAVDIREVVQEDDAEQPPRTLVVLDGTWKFASNIYTRNRQLLEKLIKVKFGPQDLFTSHYRIRKQPSESALCTLEAVAVALNILERRSDILEVALKPLHGLVSLQFHFRDQRKALADQPGDEIGDVENGDSDGSDGEE